MGKWAITLGALIVSLWLPAIQATEDNLYFAGTLVNEPCVLAEEDKLIKMDFRNVIDKDLYLNGRTKGRPIELHLQNCDLEVGKRMVSITFGGNESSESPGFLALRSTTVQGLLIGLETVGGLPLPLNKTHRMAELTSGNNLLSFNAYLLGEPKVLVNRTLGQGDFDASLTFALNYE
ncbi:type 1 fimbrial protein [Pseudomonas sichuanensis]|uniref:fimbrial protein n=1 Tax=Pseudomonas sichuanensis TaxID=2213015 RepID=UPI0024498E66|nr:fimbrial protein [Pseudomonas sichuanensis]MDH0731315.1 type 1 fimbrial protein [Pseudomonas sichuanensis]MDH1583506.1 type 1 fimbrial protein [Pseudomonas sichuanensis]MDH1592756.1 type 1 fimbrial protein [Pseudomonas sichuanensis]MDH1598651.1 type 1 fimbrial protein [Pseudomonas sichuanensis]